MFHNVATWSYNLGTFGVANYILIGVYEGRGKKVPARLWVHAV